jgi:hypothetical protein
MQPSCWHGSLRARLRSGERINAWLRLSGECRKPVEGRYNGNGLSMKYYEEEGRKETVFVLPVCRECEKTIEPGDNIYVRDDRDSIICYECGQLEV